MSEESRIVDQIRELDAEWKAFAASRMHRLLMEECAAGMLSAREGAVDLGLDAEKRQLNAAKHEAWWTVIRAPAMAHAREKNRMEAELRTVQAREAKRLKDIEELEKANAAEQSMRAQSRPLDRAGATRRSRDGFL